MSTGLSQNFILFRPFWPFPTLTDKTDKIPVEIEQQYEDNLRWLAEADKHKLVVGSQAQYIYLDSKLLAPVVCFSWTDLN